jgi:hypothetical protein
MSEEDALKIKEKIISIFKDKGPCLPVNVAKETGLSILFASAFLSEFISEKKIKISNMKVGSSPLYFIPGQEKMLENFSDYLKSKEKEAFILLKEKKILKDSEQEPAIRVALRAIKDFAIFFNKNGEIYWRYFTVEEAEIKEKEPNIPDKEIKKTKKAQKKKTVKENKFFNIVKEFLSEKNVELLEILKFSKNELILKIKTNNEEKIAIAYNKKRVNENDIIKANKEASEFNLPYLILSLGEPLKKKNEFMAALKNLSSIEKLK